MKIGLFALGIGRGTYPEVVRAVSENAERLGFATIWAPEHVALFNHGDSKYPYSENGAFPLTADADFIDPFITLTYVAAFTSRIRLGTGICLVPEHNPLVLAKQIASLDRLCGGRFTLGVGIGWSAEEFQALGIPFERRAARTREYIEAMRRLWADGVASFHGEFVNFDKAGSHPRPVRGGKLPVLMGGESMPALRRCAQYGDGWYGFNLTPEQAKEKIAKLETLLKQNGRRLDDVEIVVSPYTHRVAVDDLKRYHELGVSEVVVLMSPPAKASDVPGRMEPLAREWVEPAAKLD